MRGVVRSTAVARVPKLSRISLVRNSFAFSGETLRGFAPSGHQVDQARSGVQLGEYQEVLMTLCSFREGSTDVRNHGASGWQS